MRLPDFLQTGDLILFRDATWWSYLFEWVGRSPFAHVGMVVRNPRRIGVDLDDGVYLLESGWSDTDVHLHVLTDVLRQCAPGTVVVRPVDCLRDDRFYESLKRVYTSVQRHASAHVGDWLETTYNTLVPSYRRAQVGTLRQTDRAWGVALIAFVFDQVGLVDPINWTLITPHDFSSAGTRLCFRCLINEEHALV
jgi:hypothetical protein